MNQDQVRTRLRELDTEAADFSVIFSGKKSKKVDGLYKPESMEIIIHNKNFSDDNGIMHTAIHEFAHHLHFTRSAAPVSSRSHTREFWNTLHRLLYLAEEKKIYVNIFEKDARFVALAKQIRGRLLSENGSIMKELGRLLQEAHELCVELHASFDDFVDRVLGVHRREARTLMKVSSMDVNPSIGYENMKTLVKIEDPGVRKLAEKSFLEGGSPDMVMSEFISKKQPPTRLEFLAAEKKRLESSLANILSRISRIEKEMAELK